MSLKNHIQLMAIYNRRMNQQLYQASRILGEEKIKQDQKGFFGSIFGAFNHIMVADILWLLRFRPHSEKYNILDKVKEFPYPTRLNEIVFSDLNSLQINREKLDDIIIQWSHNEITDQDLIKDLNYNNTKGESNKRNFAELILHMFNHQTHHRGQISALLFQLGQDVGITDFIIDIPSSNS